MNKNIQHINTQIAKYKRDVVNHPLYNQLNSIEDVQKLMEVHVYAVWDFMSLLKGLQIELTSTTLPWKPIGDNKIRRLINSIVLEEESDVDADGNPASHYEMYLDAMKECGANTTEIENFVDRINDENISSLIASLQRAGFPAYTVEITASEKVQNTPSSKWAKQRAQDIRNFKDEIVSSDLFAKLKNELGANIDESKIMVVDHEE